MTYEYFKQMNNMSKGMVDVKGKVIDVDFKTNTCKLVVDGISNGKMTIQSLIENIVYDGMCAITNPSVLKNWKGFEENQPKTAFINGNTPGLTWSGLAPIERQQAFDSYLSMLQEEGREIDSKEAFKELQTKTFIREPDGYIFVNI